MSWFTFATESQVAPALQEHARHPRAPCRPGQPRYPGRCNHCGSPVQVVWSPVYRCSMCAGCLGLVTSYALDGIPDSDEDVGEPETGYGFDYGSGPAVGLDPVAFGPPLWRPDDG